MRACAIPRDNYFQRALSWRSAAGLVVRHPRAAAAHNSRTCGRHHDEFLPPRMLPAPMPPTCSAGRLRSSPVRCRLRSWELGDGNGNKLRPSGKQSKQAMIHEDQFPYSMAKVPPVPDSRATCASGRGLIQFLTQCRQRAHSTTRRKHMSSCGGRRRRPALAVCARLSSARWCAQWARCGRPTARSTTAGKNLKNSQLQLGERADFLRAYLDQLAALGRRPRSTVAL